MINQSDFCFIKEGYKGLQGIIQVKRDYRGLQGLKGVMRGQKRIQEVTGGNSWLKGATSHYRVYWELQVCFKEHGIA